MPSSEPSEAFASFFSEENLTRIFNERVKDARFTGLDGVSASSLEADLDGVVETAAKKVQTGRYRFTRYREKLILKNHRKPPRQIAIPTVRDALVLRALCDYLTEFFDDCRMKPPHDVIKRLATAASTAMPDDQFLRMDVVNFYPTIVHDLLLARLQKRVPDDLALQLVHNAIATPTGFDELGTRTVGVPQGLSISNILSMVYLHDFDFFCNLNYEYFRYVDDIVVLAKKGNVAEVHAQIKTYLSDQLRLETHPLEEGGRKTMISDVAAGTDYLGYRISSTGLSIRDTSYKKMFRAIVGCLRRLRGTATAEQVLWKLNLIVTGCRFESRSVGWVFFFRQSTDMAQFHRMDAFVAKQMGLYGLVHLTDRAKSFVKVYREIRYNRKATSYIPDFDNFTLADKIRVISLIRGLSEERLGVMEREDLDELYWSIVRGQVAKMERETVDFGANSGGY
ncbi:reverse transcriptase domain-containing protein [Frigidibacter sp. SD6-1]|uniref:reverse transcriptase domain-containing protein n=1 Tax=Frigidibacter sp. SD6-1 TaxID=3032581 RepID=UPI0024DFC9CF|nr:reverse transcriptase domain-containing protein [Frigidibacter sp. SD6-1]